VIPKYEHLHEDQTNWPAHQRRSRMQTWMLSGITLFTAIAAAFSGAAFQTGLSLIDRVSAAETTVDSLDRRTAPAARVAALESRVMTIEARQDRMEQRQSNALDEIRQHLREINSKLEGKEDRS
jgi:hypothetical protein